MSLLIQAQKKYYSEAEYLQLEETAEFKNEYLAGEIIPMVGASSNHNQICLNFCRNFPLDINSQSYFIYMETVRLWIAEYKLYTYPDIMIIQGKPQYHGKGKNNITNPLIIIEVLSQSTQGYDRVDKFKYYRSLETLQEYILIDQYSYSVEQYRKESVGKWAINFYEGAESLLQLTSVAWQISLKDLYNRVEFTENTEE
jgi:Uma2 family endonuclease